MVWHQRSQVAPREVHIVLHDFFDSWKYALQQRSTNVTVVHPDVLQDRHFSNMAASSDCGLREKYHYTHFHVLTE